MSLGACVLHCLLQASVSYLTQSSAHIRKQFNRSSSPTKVCQTCAAELGTLRDTTGHDGIHEGTGPNGTQTDGTQRDGTPRDSTVLEGTGRNGTQRDGTQRDTTEHKGTGRNGTQQDGTHRDTTGRDATMHTALRREQEFDKI